MKKYLLPKDGNFYKANLHCHSNISDGNLSPEELKALYKSHGYSVLAYTDHNVFIPHHDLSDDDFLALAGFEEQYNENGTYPNNKDIQSIHFCYIAKSMDIDKHPNWNPTHAYHSKAYRDFVKYDVLQPEERNSTAEYINASVKRGIDAGFFVTYNHPTWSLDDYKGYMSYEGMHAMEIYNHDCYTIGYESYVPHVYDDILRSGKRIFAIATDDNHNKFSENDPRFDSLGGFTMINAPSLTYENITAALFNGNLYASQGPLIHELFIEDGKINISCSEAEHIILSTNRRSSQAVHAPHGKSINNAEFILNTDDTYIRLTVIDSNGKHANTRAYFMDEIE